jgi:hypothetical protein
MKGQKDELEEFIHFVTPSAMTPHEIEQAAEEDKEMMLLKQCIISDRWEDCPVAYKAIREELACFGGLVLRGSRIVIPEKLRQRVIDIAHEGHQGIVKTKERLRTKVWWPGIDKDAEKRIRSCHACQVLSQPSPPEPLTRTKLPDHPWEHLGVDLLGPLPNGESILVAVDYYSRYFEATVLRSTRSQQVIQALEDMFTTHGLPISITTDNGPQFISKEFTEFIQEEGIEHHFITPLWPQANGEVERQNRTMMKAIRAAQVEGKDWKRELNKFLFAYRTTPHQTTGVAPAELMFKRKLRTKLPEARTYTETYTDESVRDRDRVKKEQGKQYTDQRRHAQESDTAVGDEVLVQQRKQNKFSTPFEPEPYKVVDKAGSQVTIESPSGVRYKRNVSHTKPYIRRDTSVENSNTPEPQPDISTGNACHETQSGIPEIRKSERIKKIPDKLKDFVVGFFYQR